jgi:hypothetical protein
VPLEVLNAGSTTELGAFRVFTHRRERLEAVEWVEFAATGSTRARERRTRWTQGETRCTGIEAPA